MIRQRLSTLNRATGTFLSRVVDRGRAGDVRIISPARGEADVTGLLDFTLLRPPRAVALDDPRLQAFLTRQTAVRNDGRSFQTEPIFLATLADATFDPHSGAVWAADGALLLDSIKNAGRLKHVTPRPVLVEHLPGLYSSVATPISGNTFHWLIETLPRLYSLTHVDEPVTVLMPDTLPPERREQLLACLPRHATPRFVSPHARLRVERFILPSYLTTQWDFAYAPYEHLAHVRDGIGRGLDAVPPLFPTRLYISRAGARARRVVNEAAVLDVLRPLGFRVCRLEELPFAEQVRLFQAAEIVVAPHGAGLANLLFAGRVPVLEFTSRAVNPVYFFLALALGQSYRYLYPQELKDDTPLPAPDDGRRYSAARDLDITIDLDALRAALGEWL